jgi:hypothetical protein
MEELLWKPKDDPLCCPLQSPIPRIALINHGHENTEWWPAGSCCLAGGSELQQHKDDYTHTTLHNTKAGTAAVPKAQCLVR